MPRRDATRLSASASAFRPVVKADGGEPVRQGGPAARCAGAGPEWEPRPAGPGKYDPDHSRRARQQAHAAGQPYLTDGELSARLTAAKATPERAWLGEVSAVVLQQALADLTAEYRNFFASLTGTRKGPGSRRRSSGPAKTGGRRSGSPATPASPSPQVASCGCPRSGISRSAGPVTCPRHRTA